MSKKKTFILIFLLALLLVGAINISLTTLITGPVVFSDETCALLRAQHFAETLQIGKCSDIAGLRGGDPMPLYSILISPIYNYLDGLAAYHAILIFNALLVASLLFPLFRIFGKFISKNSTALLVSVFIIFIPQIVAYEITVMTEILFSTLSIWFLYFYMESFERNRRKNKIIAIIFAILATFARPFGLMIPLAFATNEFILSKNKKKTLPLLLLAVIFSIGVMIILLPGLLPKFGEEMMALLKPINLLYGLISVKNQANSFLIATFLIPTILFFTQIFTDKDKKIQNIKYFLITFIALNFIASAQHIFGYYLNYNPLHLQTRYINVSIIYIFIFAFIFLLRKKHITFNKAQTIIMGIVILPLLFLEFKMAKFTQNLDIGAYYSVGLGKTNPTAYLAAYFIPAVTILFLFMAFGKKKTLVFTIALFALLSSGKTYLDFKQFSSEEYIAYPIEYFDYQTLSPKYMDSDTMWELFEDTEYKILYVINRRGLALTFWKLKTLTGNQVDQENRYNNWQDYDYIIGPMELPYKIVGHTRYRENIYKVTELDPITE